MLTSSLYYAATMAPVGLVNRNGTSRTLLALNRDQIPIERICGKNPAFIMTEDIFSTGNPDLDSMLKYLRVTMLLSAAHADALHKFRTSCYIDIANINTEIRHIQEKHPVSTSKLAVAKSRSVYREGQIALCTSYLSPMRRLPLELLEEIFMLSMWMSTSGTREKTPLIFRQVCAAWRTTVLGISKLWDQLRLSLSSTSCDSTHENAANLLSMWLANAGTYPISLSMSFNVPHSPCSCLLEHVVTSHSNRLRRLHFQLQRNGAELDLGRFFSLPGRHVEQLEYFSLFDSANMTETDMVTVLRDAPRLRKVQIISCGNISWFDMDTYSMLLPWMQLTHLEILFSLDPIIWQKLLQCCTLLEYCRLKICLSISGTSHPLNSLQRTTLPNLRDIQIDVESYAEAAYSWLYSFDFPVLARLKYQGGEINTFWIRHFQRTFEYLPHSLRILSLHSDKITVDNLIEFLRFHPELAELILSLATTTTNIMRLWAAMTFNHAINAEEGEQKTSNQFLSKLEVFELYVPRDYGDELSVCEFCGMVKSRWHTPLRPVLRRVKFHYANYDLSDVTEMNNLLKDCKSEGLVVWIDHWTHKRLFPDSLWRSPFRWY